MRLFAVRLLFLVSTCVILDIEDNVMKTIHSVLDLVTKLVNLFERLVS